MKTFTISKENRVANSPYTIEGTTMAFDITHEYPIPTETLAFNDKGDPITIRFIMGCSEIDKAKQLDKGYPEKRKTTEQERAMLTFIGGMLTIPEGYANLEKYMEAAPWYKGKEGEKRRRPPDTRIIYELYDQEVIDDENITMERLITDARSIVLRAGRDTLVSLLRLNRIGSVIDANINIKQVRLQLLEVANVNPDFILKSVKSARTDATVIVSKAIDYGILNIDTQGKLKMQSKSSDKLENVASIADTGGRNAKTERVVAYFESEEGKLIFGEVKGRIRDYEVEHKLVDPKDAEELVIPTEEEQLS